MSSLAAINTPERAEGLAGDAFAGPRVGSAKLEFAGGARSTLASFRAHSPLRVLNPDNHGTGTWAYLSTFGGGLLGGDQIDVDVELGPGSLAYVGTQSATKVFRSANGEMTRQRLRAHVASGALLALLPDAVACFAGACYEQTQRIELAGDASVALLDWVTSGRHARGERWEFAHCVSANEIWQAGVCLLRDRVRFPRGTRGLGMRHFNCFATAVLLGPRVAEVAKALRDEIGAMPVVPQSPVMVGASPLAEGVMVRVAGPDVESVARFIFPRLEAVAEMLGDCPWRRKW